MTGKFALLIGNSDYDDSSMSKLEAPNEDVHALASVLQNSLTGGFDEVIPLINENVETISRTIESFCSRRRPDELVLLYFSGHGKLDDKGNLFLIAKNTTLSLLRSTTISSSFIVDTLDSCRSKRQILILDCCHSGAVGYGAKGEVKLIDERIFAGNSQGRIVLTASRALQDAHEAGQIIAQTKLSLFTHYLVDGLVTGLADTNSDGEITVDEWYDFAFEKVRLHGLRQSPQKWIYGLEGKIVIALSSHFIKTPIFNTNLNFFEILQDPIVSNDSSNYRFYEGYTIRRIDLINGLDVIREQFAEVFEIACRLGGQRTLIAVISKMASGKTTFIRRLAWQLYKQGHVVLVQKFISTNVTPLADLEILGELTTKLKSDQFLYLFLDDATRIPDFQQFIEGLADKDIPSVIVVASRNEEWQNNRPSFIANLDIDPVEVNLLTAWTRNEAKLVKQKLSINGKLIRNIEFEGEDIFESMWQATDGMPYRERIRERIKQLEEKNPRLARAYVYICLLSQFDLATPSFLIESLINGHSLDLSVADELLKEEMVQYADDSLVSVTVGHARTASEVVKQHYIDNSRANRHRLIKDLSKIISQVPSSFQTLVTSLLTRVHRFNQGLMTEILHESDSYLVKLQEASSANELSQVWAKFYEQIEDYQKAEYFHSQSLAKGPNSYALVQYAQFLINQNRYREARNSLTLATTISPRDASAHSILGKLLKTMLLFEEADLHLKQALELSVNDSGYVDILAYYLPVTVYLKRYEEAEIGYRRLIEFHKNVGQPFTKHQFELIKVLLLEGNLATAIHEMRITLQHSYSLSSKLYALITSKEIEDTLRKEVTEWLDGYVSHINAQADGTDTKLLNGAELHKISQDKASLPTSALNNKNVNGILSTIDKIEDNMRHLSESGRRSDIPEFLKGLIKESKQNIPAYTAYAEHLFSMGEHDRGEDYLIGAIVNNRNFINFAIPLRYACYLVIVNRITEARNYYRHALRWALTSNSLKRFYKDQLFVDYISTLYRRGYLDVIIQSLREIDEEIFLPPDVEKSVIEHLIRISDYPYLMRLAEKHLNVSSGSGLYHIYTGILAVLSLHQQNFAEYQKYFRRILKWQAPLDALQLKALAMIVKYFTGHRDIPRASRVLTLANSFTTNNPDIIASQLELLIISHRLPEGHEINDKLLSLYPQFGYAFALRGQLFAHEGKVQDAYKAYQQAIDLDPQVAESQAKYAFFLQEEAKFLCKIGYIYTKFYKQYMIFAEKHAATAFELAPNDSYVANIYALILINNDKFSEARLVTKQTLAFSSNNVYSLVRAGEAEAHQENWNSSMAYFNKALDVAPPRLVAYIQGVIGNVLLSHDKNDEAYDYFTGALKSSKRGSQALVNMGNWWAQTRSKRKAVYLYAEALKNNPNYATARLQLADCEFQLDRIQEALQKYASWIYDSWPYGGTSVIRAGSLALMGQHKLKDDLGKQLAILCGVFSARTAQMNFLTEEISQHLINVIRSILEKTPGLADTLGTHHPAVLKYISNGASGSVLPNEELLTQLLQLKNRIEKERK